VNDINNVFKEILEKFFVFVAITFEVFLGTALGYFILLVAHYLETSVNSMDNPSGSPIFYCATAVEWLLIISDLLIVLLFAADGVRRAFKNTIGKR
jgi:hypothetical protein